MAVSKIKGASDSGWQTLSEGIKYRAINGICYIAINGVSHAQGGWIAGTLPEGFRPSTEIDFVCRQGYAVGQGYVNENGTVGLALNTAATNFQGSVSFPIN